uniref:Alternative protein NXPH3 n=1 Tax=Homo sapiens TaxID=9606 RepID=L8E9I1_HUMAN|nr:alternative protein NXPH3 [Homo sapiens]
MMVLPAQRTLSVMTTRASPGPGCLGSGATSHLSPAPWPIPLS